MIRKVIVAAVFAGLAALPGAALAQDPDTAAPTVTVATPLEGASYRQGTPVTAAYVCEDPSGVAQCEGTVANDAPIDTSQPGNFVFTVTARDTAGNATTVTRNYSVTPVDGPVEGDTPATLTLTLGPSASFDAFVPGLAREYVATLAATVLSTADNAALTVTDPGTPAPGHLVNGPRWLADPLRAAGASANEVAHPGTEGAVGTPAAPLTLLTYSGPVTNDVATLTFKQTIGETEPLRTGSYSKTLTFTLSTTAP
jgi:hypothetical protein